MIGPGESDFHRAHEIHLEAPDDTTEQEKCLECNGKGEFKMMYLDRDGSDQFEQCDNCEGSGYVYVNNARECQL